MLEIPDDIHELPDYKKLILSKRLWSNPDLTVTEKYLLERFIGLPDDFDL